MSIEYKGKVREQEGVVRVEDGAVVGVDPSEAREGVVVRIILGEGRGDMCRKVFMSVNSLHHLRTPSMRAVKVKALGFMKTMVKDLIKRTHYIVLDQPLDTILTYFLKKK